MKALPQLFSGGKTSPERTSVEEDTFLIQFRNRFILTQRQGKLLIIDQNLAHRRILFERFLKVREKANFSSQQLLFPQTMEYSALDYQALQEAWEILGQIGFEIKPFGKNTVIVYGTPTEIATARVPAILDQIIDDVKQMGSSPVADQMMEGIARAVARRSAVTSSQKLSILEMKNMVDSLFKCSVPGYAPNGKPTIRTLDNDELDKFFQ